MLFGLPLFSFEMTTEQPSGNDDKSAIKYPLATK